MIAFWRCGYGETPVGALEEATGLKRVSLYNAFGDKEGVFLAALDRYHASARDVYEGMVAQGSLNEIGQLFAAMSAPVEADAPANSGCLMVNTVLDVRRASPAVQDKVTEYRAMIRDAFVSALRNACERGEMDCDDVTIEARATYLLALLWGALALVRVEGRTTAAADVATIGREAIEGWRNERKG